MPRKKPPVEEDKPGTKCGICGEIRTRPTGYMYNWQYNTDDHVSITDCLRFLKTELEDSKSEIQDLKDRVRDLERNSRDYNEYH
jgi:hypothetical protein